MMESRKWERFESNSSKISRCLWLRRGVHKLTSSNHFWIRPEDPDPIETQVEDWSKEFERNPHSPNNAARIAEFEQACHARAQAGQKQDDEGQSSDEDEEPSGDQNRPQSGGADEPPAWGQRKVDLKVPGSRYDVETI